MEANKILTDLKDKLLVDAISFISIKNVDTKFPIDGSIALYIETNNLETVEVSEMENLVDKFSSDNVNITFLIPDDKVVSGAHEKNLDLICIYLRNKKASN
jgi:hypothetical protein